MIPDQVLVIGYGNELRRDDGLGPKLAAAIEQLDLPAVRVLTCHQLTPELAEPISHAQAVVFIDAAVHSSERVQVRRLTPATPSPLCAHNAQPSELLNLAASLFGRHPRGFWITLPAFDMGFGDGLSKRARSALACGLEVFQQLLTEKAMEPDTGPPDLHVGGRIER